MLHEEAACQSVQRHIEQSLSNQSQYLDLNRPTHKVYQWTVLRMKSLNQPLRLKLLLVMQKQLNSELAEVMESFFHTMKVELYYEQHYQTKQELIKAMKEWVEYYNQDRIKHILKGKTPIEYRNLALEKVA